ncbi:MAG: SUMF1/EgtB/PvdO family nonheme iron enzyme [Chloroflexota bacterium]
MRIFLSYASEDREAAKTIYLALRDQGHKVFFDRTDLPAGDEFHNRIRQAIESSHLFIFLLTAKSIDAGSYTLSELEIAEQSRIKLLPVAPSELDFTAIPASLKAVTIYHSDGNVAAGVAAEVSRIATEFRRKRLKRFAVGLALAAAVSGALFYGIKKHQNDPSIGRDGAPAVLIPAGVFIMGNDEDSARRRVFVDTFYLDKFEVTLARYGAFLKANGNLQRPDDWPESGLNAIGDLPVVGVDWRDAAAYCRWAGKRLPTEAEWEKAARGGDGRKYPWGDDEPTGESARFDMPSSNSVYQGGVAPVGKYSKGSSPFGVYDLAGNAAEWVNDWYAEGFSSTEVRNPRGPESGTAKVVRGGGWFDTASRITATKRMYASPTHRDDATGFRCAADIK